MTTTTVRALTPAQVDALGAALQGEARFAFGSTSVVFDGDRAALQDLLNRVVADAERDRRATSLSRPDLSRVKALRKVLDTVKYGDSTKVLEVPS